MSLETPNTDQRAQEDAIRLRFPEVYQSPEWQKLDSVSRAQLLLVAEGLKPGTIIHGNFTSFQEICGRLGLAGSLNTDPMLLQPIYRVAPEETLLKHERALLTLPEKIPRGAYHRINGEFLGYPSCCVEEYIKPQKNLEARKKSSPKQFVSNVDFEAKQIIGRGEPYPEELDFCPPSFTPCSARCENALAVLKKWKTVLEKADPEAARDMQSFNWQSEPDITLYKEELEAQHKDWLEHRKIRMLRNSILGYQEE